MEKDYLATGTVIDIEFSVQSEPRIHYHENFELLYVLKGKLTLTVEDEIYDLAEKDLVIVNYNRKHSYVGSDDLFIARFIISYSKVRELLGKDMIIFWCNSTLEKSESYDELRKIIDQVLNQQVVSLKQKNIYQISLFYQMLHVIVKNFLLTFEDIKYQTEKQSDDERIQAIFQFIRTNYQNPISLQDLADHFYLSTTYLSKYIKQKCEMSFTELINSVRLSHAMMDLLHSDQSIMKIAMRNGFASVSAYNKVFKAAYSDTPSRFRRKQAQSKSIIQQKKLQTDNFIKERLEDYLTNNTFSMESDSDKEVLLNLDIQKVDKIQQTTSFNQLINAGGVTDLLKSDFQEQIIYMRNHLGVKYIRFWDIYNPELYIDIHAQKNKLNFNRLDSAIDFLISQELVPYIELGFKPIRLLRDSQNAIVEVPREQDFDNDDEMTSFFKELLSHFIKRYGSNEVSKWYFEYWKKEDIAFLDLKTYHYSPQTETIHHEYFHKFDLIAKSFREILSSVRIGGGGFPVQHHGKNGFAKLLSLWLEHDEQPNFLTFTGFPYQLEKDSNVYYERKSTDMDFNLHNLEIVKEAMEIVSFPKVPLHVSEYSLTLSNRNPINDHPAKGAFLIQNAIATSGYADFFGHWLGLDIYADHYDSQKFLFGGCGLITKTGVTKPAFYALFFLKLLYPDIYQKDRNYLVTGNSRGSFRIICHNFKNMNYSFYLMEESKIEVSSLSHMFEDNEGLTINIKINSIPNGVYAIKSSLVNDESGSVQDEWKKFHFESEMSLTEQDYFKQISRPRLLNTQITVNNKMLDFKINLKANEFRYLHIYLV
ncbi:TPA: helix-turn-helix domain-containing protein [Listeria monocytogenes]|uniref:GH39 family glycosyl hydrolase n=1 Tax=Listeria monocytogenes TaxID=1639 RepID=UPI001990542F|nr:helix-turn-helix domain-containing protein [Listeria monocytogenes]EHL5826519.1 helix-turn-helix domain-containing protein [Listeria monocytogenes]EKC6210736.1 helix-turn-helix domain-containing protein [Listeria monocytogenes]MDA5918476.1 helix-turn-helix domain-containing protein [Listeria monocytogenes]HAK9954891.1 helix-turn-helix domain-containing protein [Listeria monocytogenes]